MMIQEEFSGSKDQIFIKGKRSKRPRLSSSTPTISCGGGGEGGGGGEFYNTMVYPSPSSSSTCTEEDEDMANCLILLATGGSPPPLEEEIKSPETKFSSCKFTEMGTTTMGKIDIYVYECKTCNRTFSSFQALGGHRASHKRPRTTTDNIDRKISPPPPSLPMRKQEEGQCTLNSVIMSPPHSIQFLGKNENKQKIHECSICGSEFGSGQALGGHMRRHRAAATANSNIKIGSVIDGDAPNAKAQNIFALDLNLPAPPEDDRTDASFYQFSTKQRPHVIVSAAALVDCHY